MPEAQRITRPGCVQEFGRVKMGLRSRLVVPLISKGRVIGTLGLRSLRVGAYGPREQAIVERLARQIAPAIANAAAYQELFSPRELEVLEQLTLGYSNNQIAEVLSITPNTVFTHVRHIKAKLKTSNRTQTALVARTMLHQS